jgi:hypothetical protein
MQQSSCAEAEAVGGERSPLLARRGGCAEGADGVVVQDPKEIELAVTLSSSSGVGADVRSLLSEYRLAIKNRELLA